MNQLIQIFIAGLLLSVSLQLGGWREVTVDLSSNDEFSRRVVDVFSAAIDHMRDTKIIPITYSFDSLIRVRTQVVAGTNWNIILALKDSTSQVRHYEVTVWEKLPNSQERFKVTAAAEVPITEEPKNEPKRELVGGYNSFSCSTEENSDICLQILAFAEPILRKFGVLGTSENLGEILDARRQVVAGMNYKFTINVTNSLSPEKVIKFDVFEALPSSVESESGGNRFSLEAFAIIGKNTQESSAVGQYNPYFSIRVRELEDLVEFVGRNLGLKDPAYKELVFKRLEDLRKKNVAGNVFKFNAIFGSGSPEEIFKFAYVILVYPPYVGHEQFKVQGFEKLSTRLLTQDDDGRWAYVKVNVAAPEFIEKMENLASQIRQRMNLGPDFAYDTVSGYKINSESGLKRVIIILKDKNGSNKSFSVTFRNSEILNAEEIGNPVE